MYFKNKFSLHGTVKYFDEHPMKRLLLLEYPGPYQPSVKSTCSVYVRGACIIPPDKDIEPGDKVIVVGQITDILVGKTRVPRLIADEISREDERPNTDHLIRLLEEAEAKVMLVHAGADESDRDDLEHVINLLNDIMAELKGGTA
jgi:hypothetical protein